MKEPTVASMFGLNIIDGDIGFEIEMEGDQFPDLGISGWNHRADGSLRGNSVEFVLKGPQKLAHFEKSMGYLITALRDWKTVIRSSVRTGVHCHVNVQKLKISELVSFATLYYIFEGAILRECGEDREGNLFCLRATDTDYALTTISECVNTRNFQNLGVNLRYSALNFMPLNRFGSVEFRSKATPYTLEEFHNLTGWGKMFVHLRDMSLKFPNGYDMWHQVRKEYRSMGASWVIRKYLEPYAEQILKACGEMGAHTLLQAGFDISEEFVKVTKWPDVPKNVFRGIGASESQQAFHPQHADNLARAAAYLNIPTDERQDLINQLNANRVFFNTHPIGTATTMPTEQPIRARRARPANSWALDEIFNTPAREEEL